ncbi:HK97 gp10 family phage protein [Sinorhizobium meliloti]|nr:HK97 gp10 family phage protein [Sinorhizobium meliloti]
MALKAKIIGRNELLRQMALIEPNIVNSIAGMQMKVARELAQKIQTRAPVGSAADRGRPPGYYRDSIHADRLADRPDAKLKGLQRTTDPNATGIFALWIWHFLEFGTQPHTIRARNAPRLVFTGRDGERVSAVEVSHPGTPAQPHIFPTYRAERTNIARRVSRAMRSALKKALANQSVSKGQEPAD